MTPQFFSKLHVKIDHLTEEIEELQRQKYKLQEVYDFGDFIETHYLIEQEIEKLQHQLREEKNHLVNSKATNFDEDTEEAKEYKGEEESFSSSS